MQILLAQFLVAQSTIYKGLKMAVSLGKSISTDNSIPAPAPAPAPADPTAALRFQLTTKIFDGYCDEATMNSLLLFAVQTCGLEQKKAEIILAMELESMGVANEKVLLVELDALLHRFTDKDQKLDDKEKNDTIQFLCKARTGYKNGLNFDVANQFITTFCRNNRVKVKVGFLKWDIP